MSTSGADTADEPTLRRTLAACVALGISVLVVGVFVIGSVHRWLEQRRPAPPPVPPKSLTVVVVEAVVCIALSGIALALIRYAHPTRPRPRTTLSGYAPALLLLPGLSVLGGLVWVMVVIAHPGMSAAAAPDPRDHLFATWSWTGVAAIAATSLLAGITEEVLALAVPVLFAGYVLSRGPEWLRRRRTPAIWALGATLVAVRMTYHLYQGSAAVSHLPWAVATVALYLHTRRLLPIVVAHVVADVQGLAYVPLRFETLESWTTAYLLPLILLGVVVAVVEERVQTRRSGTAGESDTARLPDVG